MEAQTTELGGVLLGASWAAVVNALLRATAMFLLALLVVPRVWRHNLAAMAPFEAVLLAAFGVMAGYTIVSLSAPLLPAMAAMALIAGLYRVALLEPVSALWRAGAGHPQRLAIHGRLEPEAIRAAGLTHSALLSALRQAGIAHLGQVKAAYVEHDGRISVVRCRAEEERAGLPTMPLGDGAARGSRLRHAINQGPYACSVCGQVLEMAVGAPFAPCPSCEGRKWVPAHAGSAVGADEPLLDEEPTPVPEKVQ